MAAVNDVLSSSLAGWCSFPMTSAKCRLYYYIDISRTRQESAEEKHIFPLSKTIKWKCEIVLDLDLFVDLHK